MGENQFDPLLADCLVRLGGIESELGDETTAKQVLLQALTIWRRAPQAIEPQYAPSLLDLGRWLVEQRRCVDAVPLLQLAEQVFAAQKGTVGPELVELENLLGACPTSA